MRGASFTTPVSISGATSPAALAMAKIKPVKIPGRAQGRITCQIVSNLVAPNPTDPSRKSLGTADRPSSVATMTTGTVSRAKVSDAQRMPPVPKVGFGNDSGKGN